MYQVSWIKNDAGQEADGFMFIDAWSAVEEWMAMARDDERITHWTVSMVMDSSDVAPVEYIGSDDEEAMTWLTQAVDLALRAGLDSEDTVMRGHQVMQALSLLPPRMKDEEVFATVLNLVTGYIENPAKAARILSVCSESVREVQKTKQQFKHQIN